MNEEEIGAQNDDESVTDDGASSATDGVPPVTDRLDRRRVLKAGLAAATGGLVAAQASASEPTPEARSVSTDGPADGRFLPEEFWKDRMKAPDDGKRYGWIVDSRRCFGCHACEVACKAENDVPLGNFIRQTIYHDTERSSGAHARIMVPMACQHCEDAPCIKACPCGAMHKGAGGSVQVDYDSCSGHGSCKEACPYGAIYIDPVANQAIKCHNCTHRLEHDMEPACVATCPSGALTFGDLADPDSKISKLHSILESEEALEQLRPEKETRPRTWYASRDDLPASAVESKLPREGQSYHPDAYSVYEWQETTPPHTRTPHPADVSREQRLAGEDKA